ncbi:MAG: hypothetical protein IPJ98_13860 [Bryobacterales bacterium]|nr:hypothetical protein [Bryobacterales bacterium]
MFNPIGVTADAGGNVFVSDSANQRIRRVDAASPNHLHRRRHRHCRLLRRWRRRHRLPDRPPPPARHRSRWQHLLRRHRQPPHPPHHPAGPHLHRRRQRRPWRFRQRRPGYRCPGRLPRRPRHRPRRQPLHRPRQRHPQGRCRHRHH